MREVQDQEKMRWSETLKTHGSVFFLKRRAGTGQTYLLYLLKDIVEYERLLVQMRATTGIAGAIYEDRTTLQGLVGLRLDDNNELESSEHPTLSKYEPRSYRAKLARKTVFLVLDEAPMCPKMLFDIMKTIWKTLRNSTNTFEDMVIGMAGE